MNFVDMYQKYWKNGYVLTDQSLGGVDREMFRSLFNPVTEVFRKYPAGDCHLYTFGPGVPILGPELVTNGDFNSPDGWVTGGGWSVSGGKAVASSVPAWLSMYRPIAAIKGGRYQVTMVVSSYVSGAVYAQIGTYPDSEAGVPRTAAGTYTDILTALADSSLVELYSNGSGFSGSVESITVREILGYSNTYGGFVAGNYFDSAGTTHASIDGSVGLVLDTAGSLWPEVWNSEIVGMASGWSREGEVFTSDGTAGNLGVGPALIVGKTYKFTAMVSGGNLNFYLGASTFVMDKTGNVSWYGVASDTNIYVQNTSAGTKSVTNLSVKEVTGIHASQSTPGHKPTLRKGIVNRANDSHNVGGWPLSNGATRSGNVISFPNEYALVAVGQSQAITSGPATIAFKLSGAGTCKILQDTSGAGGAAAVASVILTAEPTIYVGTFTATNTFSAILSRWGGDTATSVTAECVGIFAGTLTAAQILAAGGIPLTTTAPASSQAGPNYLEFDGVDDRLSLSAPLFQMSDDWCVVAAARLNQAGATSTIFSQSNVGNHQVPYLHFNSAGLLVGALYDGADAIILASSVAYIGVPVVVAMHKVGGSVTLRVNGVQVASGNAASLISTTLTTVTIGGFNGGLLLHKGNIYDLIQIKGTLTLADVQLLEKQAAAAAGIQL